MFNGGTRKRMLAVAIGSNSSSLGMESSHHSSSRSKLHDQSSMSQNTNNLSRPGMPHNAAAAASVAGRATLAAARAACAAACVVQASASSSGKEMSVEEAYGGIDEFSDHAPNNKVSIN